MLPVSPAPAIKVTEALKQQLPVLTAQTAGIVKTFGQVEQSFPQKHASCAQEMVKLRSSAVCTVCSGRGSAALDKGKLRVSEDTCSEFIQTCFDSWTMLIQIMNGMKRGKEIAEKLQVTHPSLGFPYRVQFVDAMAAWLQATGLERHLAQCDGAQACPTAAKSGICGAVLNVEQATFLEDALELILKGRKSASPAELQGFDNIKTRFRADNKPATLTQPERPHPSDQESKTNQTNQSTPTNTQPLAAPVQTRPAAPVQTRPAKPVQTRPAAPVQTRPAKPVQTRPAAPVQTKPAAPVQTRPAAPVQTKPAKPVQTRPAKPVQTRPAAAVQTKPAKPIKNRPITRLQVKSPTKPVRKSPKRYLIYSKSGKIIGFRSRSGVYYSVSR